MEDGTPGEPGLSPKDLDWLITQHERSNEVNRITHLGICCYIAALVNLVVACNVWRQRIDVPLTINKDAFIAPLTWWVLGANVVVALTAFLLALRRPNRLLLSDSRRWRQGVLVVSFLAFGVAIAM